MGGTTYAAGDRAEVDVMVVAGRDGEMDAARVTAETREMSALTVEAAGVGDTDAASEMKRVSQATCGRLMSTT